ncbi:MAG: alpha/beta fold hydrolase [Pyrinomonadaceae bacterium]
MPTIKVGDTQLYYEAHGAGESLVLIPGFGFGVWMWFKQVPALAQKFRTIVFDPRGIGCSSKPTQPFSIRTLADDVAALFDALALERAHVLGASFGGFVAQEFALAYPEKMDRLILCCTSFGGARHLPPGERVLQALASTERLNTPERMRKSLRLSFSPQYLAEQTEEVERMIAMRLAHPVSDEVYSGQLGAAMSFDAAARVDLIDAPTLVITGDEDRVVPADNSRHLAAIIPRARLQVIAGGSHQFFVERADDFNRAVIEFINEADEPLRPPLQTHGQLIEQDA